MSSKRKSAWRLGLGLAAGVVVGAGLLSNFAGSAPVASEDANRYPNRPVKIVVPVAAGGSADKLARTLAQKLGEKWRQSVVVENQPGASSAIGNAAVAHARGDGYTLLLAGDALSLNALQASVPYDPVKDLQGVTKAVVNPQLLVVRPGLGVKTFQEFVALVKQRPGEISLALPGGTGSLQHLAVELLNERMGAKTNQIPYPGGGPATLDVLGGHVDAMLITLAAATENVRSGKLVALAVTTPTRSGALPDVPTMQEAGLPDYAVESWQGLSVPASTPRAVVDRINRDVVAVLREPDTAALLENLGFTIAATAPEAVDQTVRDDIATYRRIIASADVKLK
ncbi:ABC transporter substrate-binding protein [Achromobacter spanius]|uniref:ABC transporter substrate-binding protein n=1 Tax=Achromobacter spanius TaxID=217203 RepID=A0A2S5GIQ4_9BURK|nr:MULTISPECIES: tripartite tricarboxylate transporter substrate binding protein [Achromobacter]AYD64975.1 tripartite tricarboxylate transporter substrate binding protein [Achromobacter sp. B7]MDX3984629.1 tripartite tricarboxylate transporter substrate binding protein [Achromobacter sp.]PPA72743.1 ABC transporter substrate-binding protein [Achromobacter spanius]